jgi:hypothetical protein
MEINFENTALQPIGDLLVDVVAEKLRLTTKIRSATSIGLEIHAKLPERPIIDPIFQIPPLFHFSFCPRDAKGGLSYISSFNGPRTYLIGDIYLMPDGRMSAKTEYGERMENDPEESAGHFLDRFVETSVIPFL